MVSAPLPTVTRGLRIVVSGTMGTSKWANVMHAQCAAGPPTSGDLLTLAGLWEAKYAARLLEWCTSAVNLTQVVVTDISSLTGAAGLWSGNVPGANAGTAMPAQVAMCVSWKIARRYRGGHPRTYLIGLPSAMTSDQAHWSQTQASNVSTAAFSFITDVNALTTTSTGLITFSNVSYYAGKQSNGKPQLRPTPVVDAIQGAHVDLRLDTQRRRLGKGGG